MADDQTKAIRKALAGIHGGLQNIRTAINALGAQVQTTREHITKALRESRKP
jgi:hypothetical protein